MTTAALTSRPTDCVLLLRPRDRVVTLEDVQLHLLRMQPSRQLCCHGPLPAIQAFPALILRHTARLLPGIFATKGLGEHSTG